MSSMTRLKLEAVALGARLLSRQQFVDLAMIGEPGQRVGAAEALQAADQPGSVAPPRLPVRPDPTASAISSAVKWRSRSESQNTSSPMGPSAERMGTVRQLFSLQAIMVSPAPGIEVGIGDVLEQRNALPTIPSARQGSPPSGMTSPRRSQPVGCFSHMARGDDGVELAHVLVGHAFTDSERRGRSVGDDRERVLEVVRARDGLARLEHRGQRGVLRLLSRQRLGVLNGEGYQSADRAGVGDPLGGDRCGRDASRSPPQVRPPCSRATRGYGESRGSPSSLQHRVLGRDSVAPRGATRTDSRSRW